MYFFENNSPEITPPIPCTDIEVRISTEHNANFIVARVILDTGADITVIPSEQLDKIIIGNKVEYETLTIEGYGSGPIHKKAYYVIISIDGCPPIIDRVIKGDDQVGLLGRNVSNHFITHLDGPSLKWLMETPENSTKSAVQVE